MPVEGEGGVVEAAALDVLAIEIDIRPASGDLRGTPARFDAVVGADAEKVRVGIDAVDGALSFRIGSVFTGEEVTDEAVGTLKEHRGTADLIDAGAHVFALDIE